MKIKRNTIFRILCSFILTAFILESSCLLCPSAYAELSCWNDAALGYSTGGSNILPGISKGNPNPLGTVKVADPVNITTGNYAYEHLDLSIPSRGLPLEFKRFYNSQDDYDGPFGIGWSHTYNIFLIQSSDDQSNYVIRRNPDGNKDKFIGNPDGTYSSPDGIFDTLTKNGQTYTITTKNGIAYQFNQTGYLSSITDRNGNQLTFTYDTNTGVLTTITDTVGRKVNLAYTAERKVSSIRDFMGRVWQYAYSNNDLISVTTPATTDYVQGTVTAYSYLNHNLNSITDARGNVFLNITYDDNDKVSSMILGEGTYSFTFSKNLSTQIDPNGVRTDYALNDDGTINKKTEYYTAINYETKYEYNSDKLITKIVYPKGNSVVYAYDTKGNLTQVTRKPKTGSAEPNIVTTFTYEPRYNFVKTTIDPLNNTTTYYYDYEEAGLGDLHGDGITNFVNGNLVKISYPKVNSQTPEDKFTCNTYGQLLTTINPNGNITKYEYDFSTGYLTKNTQAQGALNIVSEITYDSVGNIKTAKDPRGNIVIFEYDSHNNLIKTIAPAPFNYETLYKYDANDNLIQLDKQTNDPGNPWQTMYRTYDVMDKLLTTKDQLNNVTTFGYDANGNRNFIQDAEGNSTTYKYDERNMLKSVTDALGNITEYAYDENGNLKQIKDAKGNVTTYVYDDFDRLSSVTYADSSHENYTYDANSNILTKQSPKGEVVSYAYDALNRITQKTPPAIYNLAPVTYSYDLGSRLTDTSDVSGTIHYNYDAANRITKTIFPDAKEVSYEYDANSNRTKLIYPDASYVTYTYDELNRLANIKNQSGANIANYTYDALSRRTNLNYANSTQTDYAYDTLNRLNSLTNKTGATTISSFSYTYDNVANRKTMTTPDGIHTYTYDNSYQIKNVDYPAGFSFTDTAFNYDATSNRTSTVNSGTTTYTSNNLNQYTQVDSNSYSHDLNGNLITDSNFTYTYDYENRLVSSTKTGVAATYKYDSSGRRTEKTVNGATTKFLYDGDQIIAEYDGAGSLISKFVYGTGIDEVISITKGASTYYYNYDGLGSVTNLTNSSGTTVESYSYDVFGKPSAASTIGNTRMFTGREYDTETGLYYYRARYYSPTTGRFLQRDPVGYASGNNFYTYCESNPVNAIDPYGLLTIIVHGIGSNNGEGFSGALGDYLKANGERVVEYYWSGSLLALGEQSEVSANLAGMLENARRLADATGEDLNIISHSQGTRIAYKAIAQSDVKIDNFVTLGSPYASQYSFPGNVSKWINIWSQLDPFSYPSPFTRGYDIRINSGHTEYWNESKINPQLKEILSRLLFGKDTEKTKKK